MKSFLPLLALLLLASLPQWSCQPAQAQQKPAPTYRHVLVIGVDGMSPDGISKAKTPILDGLIAAGAYTAHARGVMPTSSSPNWASMIMGAGPEQHGITSNEWKVDKHTLPPVVEGSSPSIFPTIFGILKKARPEATTAAIYHWGDFGRLFEKTALDYDQHGEDEFITTRLAVEHIKAQKPTFTFVHLDHVDHAGHSFQHGSAEYYASVEVADSLIGEIVQATKEAGIFDDMLLIISADHGGVGFGHGGESLAEIEIPFLLAGPNVKVGFSIVEPVYTYDNAATVAWALGVRPPYAWIGRPVRSAFTNFAPLVNE